MLQAIKLEVVAMEKVKQLASNYSRLVAYINRRPSLNFLNSGSPIATQGRPSSLQLTRRTFQSPTLSKTRLSTEAPSNLSSSMAVKLLTMAVNLPTSNSGSQIATQGRPSLLQLTRRIFQSPTLSRTRLSTEVLRYLSSPVVVKLRTSRTKGS